MIDARRDCLAAADPAAVRQLRDSILGPLRWAVAPTLPVADRIARSWLRRSASPYLAEIDAIAAHTGVSGVYAINISYEYACTTVASAVGPGGAPTLRRTLDWPFRGLGRSAIVAHRSGPAGEFLDVTWPGAVGSLTALAPGRFAAAINQAPLRRRTSAGCLRGVDYARNLARTLAHERGMPPLHLLRHTFETAPDFAAALDLLTNTELARPALFTIVGSRPDEMAIVERREREATVHLGPGSVANDWRECQSGWESRPSAMVNPQLDSITRCQAIERAVAASDEPFAWVVPPVRNWYTRIAIEMNAGEGWLRAMGYEPSKAGDVAAVTEPFACTLTAPQPAAIAG